MGSGASCEKLELKDANGEWTIEWHYGKPGKVFWKQGAENELVTDVEVFSYSQEKDAYRAVVNDREEVFLPHGVREKLFDAKLKWLKAIGSVRKADAAPVKPGCLNTLGTFVESVHVSPETPGLFKSIDCQTWYKPAGCWPDKIRPPQGPADQAVIAVDGVFSRIGLGPFEGHESLPPGIHYSERIHLVDTRTSSAGQSDARSGSAAASINTQGVGLHIGMTLKNLDLTQVNGGEMEIEIQFSDPKVVIEWPHTEVPDTDLGKPFVGKLIAGAQAKAILRLQAGEEVSTHDRHRSASVDASISPLVPEAHFGIRGGSTETHYVKSGPILANITVEGFGGNANTQTKKFVGQPADKVVDALRASFKRQAEKPEKWQVLHVEVFDNEMANPDDQEVFIAVGNPGAGKSTLLNSHAEKQIFNSGFSPDYHGVTYQMDEKRYRGRRYIDTPGLTDPGKIQLAAEAISLALKQGGKYRILFVMALRQGRIPLEDITTMHLVLMALGQQVKDNQFGIVINEHQEDRIATEAELPYIHSFLFGSQEHQEFTQIPRTSQIFFNRKTPELDGATNEWRRLSNNLRGFIQAIPRVEVKSECVDKIRTDEFEEKLRKLTDQHRAELKKLEKEHQRKMEEDEAKVKELEREIVVKEEELQREMLVKEKDLQREMEGDKAKVKDLRRQNMGDKAGAAAMVAAAGLVGVVGAPYMAAASLFGGATAWVASRMK